MLFVVIVSGLPELSCSLHGFYLSVVGDSCQVFVVTAVQDATQRAIKQAEVMRLSMAHHGLPFDETLKKIAHELTENLRKNITVDWSKRESVRASLRLMVKRILRKYKYPPDMADSAVELVLMQAETLGEAWSN